MGNSEELTGAGGPGTQHVTGRGTPLSRAWIPADFLARTRAVWSKAYGRPVGEEEAVEILTNVRRLAEVLMKAKRGGNEE